MPRSILTVVRQIKADVAPFLSPELIRSVCKKVGHTWRERVLDPVATIHLFILQILHGNTACNHVPRLGAVECSGEAYCQARARLPLSVFRELLKALCHHLGGDPTRDESRWHGHRTFLIDGSSVSMPDTKALQNEFGQPGCQRPGCGFPVMHLLALFHAGSGLLLNMTTAPLRTHDMSRIGQVHPTLEAGDVLVGDRAFCSFAHLAMLAKRGIFSVFRAHQKQIISFRPHRRDASKQTGKHKKNGLPTSRWLKQLGRNDQLVEYLKPQMKPRWMSDEAFAALPETLTVRETRYSISQRGCRTRVITLVSTLLDPVRYPAADLAKLYGQRWQIELNFRHLKQTMRMDVLHCETVNGVMKELTVYALVYNLIRLAMMEAAHRQKAPIDRISFIDALRWFSDSVHGETPLQLRLNPKREGRWEPRVVKRRPKEYFRLTQPRSVLRKRLRQNKDAA